MSNVFGKSHKIDIKRDLDLQKAPLLIKNQNYQYVFTLGGDGTFVNTARFITDNTIPLIGVCSDPNRSAGHLTSIKFDQSDQNNS